jgi:hypothetical protein
MVKKISILEANRERFDKLVDKEEGILLKFLVEIEEHWQKDGEERRANKIESSGLADYSQVSHEAFVVVEDVSIRFKYSYDGEYWHRKWEIGGLGFTYEPVREWVVSLDNEDTKEAISTCIKYFRISYEFKNSDSYRYILSKLEGYSTIYKINKRIVGANFDISDGKGINYKCKLRRKHELTSVKAEVDGSISTVFKIDKWEMRENKEIATEILGRLLEDRIKEEVEVRFNVT